VAAANLIVRLGREYPAEIRARLIVLGAIVITTRARWRCIVSATLVSAAPTCLRCWSGGVRDSDVHVRLAALAVLTRLTDASDAAAKLALGCLETDSDPGVRGRLRSRLAIFTTVRRTRRRRYEPRRQTILTLRGARGARRTGAPGETIMAIKSTSLNDSVAALRDLRVLEFIVGARIARLATADASGAPHNVPLCYWFDGERIYFAIDEKPKRQTGMQLKRMRNIVENPRVALLIDHYEEDWAQLAS